MPPLTTTGELREDLTRRLLSYCVRNQLSVESLTWLIAGEIELAELQLMVEGLETEERAADPIPSTQ